MGAAHEAECVVDGFEAVKIKGEDGDFLAAQCITQVDRKMFAERNTVRQAGQRIVPCEMIQFRAIAAQLPSTASRSIIHSSPG